MQVIVKAWFSPKKIFFMKGARGNVVINIYVIVSICYPTSIGDKETLSIVTQDIWISICLTEIFFLVSAVSGGRFPHEQAAFDSMNHNLIPLF